MRKKLQKLSRRYKQQVIRDIITLSQKDIDEYILTTLPLEGSEKMFVESSNVNDPMIKTSNSNNAIYFERGYANTALFLLSFVDYSKNYLRKDSYIFPAIFCIRMYLELIMKLILTENNTGFDFNHDLCDIWDKVKRSMNLEEDDKEVCAVGNIISEIKSIDPYSTSFRYPTKLNKKCRQHSGTCINHLIDIKILRTRFLQLYKFFDGIHDLSIIQKKQQ